jgi:hypothetical protein
MSFDLGGYQVKVFKQRPDSPDSDTYYAGIPLDSKSNQGRVIILYAPDLQNIGSIDNTNSAATTTYAKSVSTGFTFAMTESINISATIEANVEFAKGSLTVSTGLTFSQQWSKTTTETYTFQVPPNKKAFTYQGHMMSVVLVHNDADDTYSYDDSTTARCLTNVLATTGEPLPIST